MLRNNLIIVVTVFTVFTFFTVLTRGMFVKTVLKTAAVITRQF